MNPLFVICDLLLGRQGRTRQFFVATFHSPTTNSRRVAACLILIAVAGLAFGANPSAPVVAVEQPVPVVTAETVLSVLNSGDISGAEHQLPDISDPVARLFVQARIEQAKGDPHSAIQTLSQLIVRYSSNTNWLEQSDLLSAKLYVELGLLEAADVTARQVQTLYEGTESAEKATVLRTEIEKLKEDAK